MMKKLQVAAMAFFRKHPGKSTGAILGVLLAIAILVFGFFNVFFVVLLGFLGLFIGMNYDRDGNTFDNIMDFMPKKIHRWY